MFCPHCGKDNQGELKYCLHCGSPLGTLPHPSEQPAQATVVERPTPTALIASGWVVSVLMLFDRAFGSSLGVIFEAAALICAVVLISSKNHTGKTNGWFILALWLIWFLIGFISGYANRVNGSF
ncbi:MAG TPA: zinc ribbon domain-containing protein [Candidatus Acidoferrales bacterium]|nr:zinc ribbon domain-containing protein [Candidatus Acidoferrales bacterium]